ncbi:3-phosphoshikimate 1-carboxyvinyltransferase [Ornithinibacillus scapharcae]|uniref:3-phosphoshikimate 1-carboxyvinyltransferase n=1 Tax=Ornithinibacillus scapharcae TaxID=1147159 RepID=UPI000225BA31|nr:3-phosphoshikimate 1-carboxyvinyltransferase [Ornithinibacillus scapharcae]
MKPIEIKGRIQIKGSVEVPGDKSISHRAIMLGSISHGTTKIDNFLEGEDCLRTVNAFRLMGVPITMSGSQVWIEGKGIQALKEPHEPIYFGNSGTTARLMLGLLASIPFSTFVYGDESLTNRPMDRVLLPLKEMGLQYIGRKNSSFLPLALKGGDLKGITYKMNVKSAQVKSAILLAGLFAQNKTKVIEDVKTRNHTENMLQAFGANIIVDGNEITIDSTQTLTAKDVFIPGDISSAAFLMAAAAIVPNSELTLKNIGLNPTRSGIIEVLIQMGANLFFSNEKIIGGEPIGDVHITYSPLTAVTIEGEMIPRLIDEIPIIALLATQAEGTTVIKNAEELRLKETDRIEAVVDVISRLGGKIEAREDGMIIEGKTPLQGASVITYHDHRIAMMSVIASLITQGNVETDDLSSISISYPNFLEDLHSVMKEE